MVSTIQNYVDLIDKKTEDNKKNAYTIEERFMLAAAIVTFAKDNKKYPKPFEYGTLYGWFKQALFGDVGKAPGLTDSLKIGKHTYWASTTVAVNDAWKKAVYNKKVEIKDKNNVNAIKEDFKSKYSMVSYIDYAKKVYKRLKNKKLKVDKKTKCKLCEFTKHDNLKDQLNFLWNKITSEKAAREGHLTKCINNSSLFNLANGKLSLNISNVNKNENKTNNKNKPGF